MRCLSVIISALIFTFFVSGQTDKLPKLKRGSWTGNLQLSGTDKLPFQKVVKRKGEKITMIVINEQEVIELEQAASDELDEFRRSSGGLDCSL